MVGALEQAIPEALAVSAFAVSETADLWEIEWLLAAPDATALRRHLAHVAGLAEPARLELALAIVPSDTDWVRRGLSEQPAVRVGRFRIHGAHLPRLVGGLDLTIDAGLGFGTGAHASTRGCLVAIERLAQTKRIRAAVDIGTGSGVLALAAARLLRIPVLATDNDRHAVTTAAANVRRHRLTAQVRVVAAEGFCHRAIRRGAPYDLATMNLLARPLVALAPACARHLRRGGWAVLSGIVERQAGGVVAAYRSHGFTVDRVHRSGEWRTLVMVRRRSRTGAPPAGQAPGAAGGR